MSATDTRLGDPRPATHLRTDRTRFSLLAGALSAPLFATVAAVQVVTKEGFDLDRHMLSLLAVGPAGFVQVANFVLTGLLVVGAGYGLRTAMPPGAGSGWAPRLVMSFGTGMVVAGVFTTDPAAGYPPGTPVGPGVVSWHGMLHGVGFLVAMVSWLLAFVVIARWHAGRGQHRHAALVLAVLLLGLSVATVPYAAVGARVALLSVLQLATVGAVCLQFRRCRR